MLPLDLGEISRRAEHPVVEAALARHAEGDFSRAADLAREALAEDSGLARAWNCLGASLIHMNREAEAIDCYWKAVEADPTMLRAWYNLGNRFRARGRGRSALYCYREAADLEPREPGDWAMKTEALHEISSRPSANRRRSKSGLVRSGIQLGPEALP